MTLQNTDYDWKYYAEPCSTGSLGLKNQQSFWPRGKMLGGCSAINALLYTRGNRRDFDDYWQKVTNSDWSWDSVLPYFKKSERNLFPNVNEKYHGTEGHLKIDQFPSTEFDDYIKLMLQNMFEELSFNTVDDINGEPFIGFGKSFGTVHQGTRQSAAKAFLNPSLIESRKNLHIIKMAHVKKLNIDKQSKRVTGVEFVRLPEQKSIIAKAKKETILSAGAVNTPQILMLSGIGPDDELNSHKIEQVHSLAGVGKNLQDHIMVPYAFSLHKSTAQTPTYEFLAANYMNYIQQRQGMLSNLGSIDYMGFISTVNDTTYPDVQVMNYLIPKANTDIMKMLLTVFNYEDGIIDSIVAANREADTLLVLVVLLNPKSRGTITLRNNNPFESPKIHTNYLHEIDDVKTLVRAMKMMSKLMTTVTFKEHEGELIPLSLQKCDRFSKESDKYWECYVRHLPITVYHASATCKMGFIDDKESVVDARLNVHGIHGLRIADASM